jgi:hypothetical protein
MKNLNATLLFTEMLLVLLKGKQALPIRFTYSRGKALSAVFGRVLSRCCIQ